MDHNTRFKIVANNIHTTVNTECIKGFLINVNERINVESICDTIGCIEEKLFDNFPDQDPAGELKEYMFLLENLRFMFKNFLVLD